MGAIWGFIQGSCRGYMGFIQGLCRGYMGFIYGLYGGYMGAIFLCWLEACLAEGSLMASAGHLADRVLPARPPARAARGAALGLGPHRLLDCVAPPLAGRGHPNHPLAMGLPTSGCEPRASLPLSLVGSRRSSLTMPGQPADKASLLHALYFRHKKSICHMPLQMFIAAPRPDYK